MTKRRLTAATAALFAASCAVSRAEIKDPVDAIQARQEIPEEQLLDVGVEIFDAGVGAATPQELEEQGISAEVRESESRFMPYHLKQTLESTGHWGAVRVVPRGVTSVDVVVRGRILKSNGKDLVLAVEARDATGRLWLEKRYEAEADEVVYHDAERAEAKAAPAGAAAGLGVEPYQSLYNQIANDVLAGRARLAVDELLQVRRVTRLRFAADLAPVAFAGYLVAADGGRTLPGRLPSREDPMLGRVERIRERDQMFVDTLNEFYANFYAKMDQPYDDWRRYSYVEQLALEELNRQSKLRKILGAVAVLGALVLDGDSRGSATARDAAIIGGVAAIRSGMEKGAEAEIHKAALQELAASFDAEVEPLLVEVEGQTMRLTGSAETQYAQWRDLLRELFVTERGMPIDPNAGVTVEAPTPH